MSLFLFSTKEEMVTIFVIFCFDDTSICLTIKKLTHQNLNQKNISLKAQLLTIQKDESLHKRIHHWFLLNTVVRFFNITKIIWLYFKIYTRVLRVSHFKMYNGCIFFLSREIINLTMNFLPFILSTTALLLVDTS